MAEDMTVQPIRDVTDLKYKVADGWELELVGHGIQERTKGSVGGCDGHSATDM